MSKKHNRKITLLREQSQIIANLRLKVRELEALIRKMTNGEETHFVTLEGGKVYLVPEGILNYNEHVGTHWQKDRDKIEELQKEVQHLKEMLFCCGEIATVAFDNTVAEIVDKTLHGFKVPESRFKELLHTLNNKRPN